LGGQHVGRAASADRHLVLRADRRTAELGAGGHRRQRHAGAASPHRTRQGPGQRRRDAGHHRRRHRLDRRIDGLRIADALTLFTHTLATDIIPMTTFTQKLDAAWKHADSLLMVGLDPDPMRFPAELHGRPDAIYEFCRGVIDATAPYVCGIKPQIAYFAAQGAEEQLEALCRYVGERYPQLPLVLDAKRGDIGSTAEQYAREAFERF